ncbi:MAG: hypothetical protein ACKV22_01020 [Bryobacteraceae bacterium]
MNSAEPAAPCDRRPRDRSVGIDPIISDSRVRYRENRTSASDIVSRITIKRVAAALGLPVRHGRTIAVWREGTHYSVSLDDPRGVWYDHVTGDGGGVLDLIVRVQGGTRAEALRWLADYCGVTLDDRTLTAAERCEWARRRRVDEHDATDAEDYYLALGRGLEADLAQAKSALLWALEQECEPLAEFVGRHVHELTRAAGLIHRATDRTRLEAYRASRAGQPQATWRLLRRGREMREADEVLCAHVVAMLRDAERRAAA